MLRRHLGQVARAYLSVGGGPSEEFSDYDQDIRELKSAAEKSGDLPSIKLALDFILTTPGVNLREYGGGQFPYSEEALHDLFRYVWRGLWPGETLSVPGEAAAIELVEMPSQEWDRLRKKPA